jgi:serine/threonine-protein kinase
MARHRRKLTHSPHTARDASGPDPRHRGIHVARAGARQSRGKRADIWAFGVVVYEMLTGRRPFEGEDVSTTVAAVIQSEPRWDRIPHSMLRLLKRCLAKDPRRRLRDIGDVWELLDVEASTTHSRSGTAGWIAAAVATIAAAIALWAPWRVVERRPNGPLVQLEMDLGPDVTLPPLVIPTPSSVAISPDGRAHRVPRQRRGRIGAAVCARARPTRAIEIAGTEGAANPSFSPDGQWVLFFDVNRLKKVSVTGGAPVPLMEAAIFAGATWPDDRTLLVGSGIRQGLLRASADGGAPTQILAPSGTETFYATPSMLPGGTDALIAVYSTPPNADTAFIDVLSLKDGSRKTVARGGTAARYVSSGPSDLLQPQHGLRHAV